MRCETGPIRFGDDWPGVFIRGDNAAYYAHIVRRAATSDTIGPDRLMVDRAVLKGLAELLESCRCPGDGTAPGVQLKPYSEVAAGQGGQGGEEM